MTKRELYTQLFPDREARNNNRHYTRFTLPGLLKEKARREQAEKELEEEIASNWDDELYLCDEDEWDI